jgi:branched-chain amino acid transport system substrate-binding protein
MSKWRKWSAGLAAMALMAGVTACGSGGAGSGGPGNSGGGNAASGGGGNGSGGQIVIGLSEEITGPAALSGLHGKRGAELAVEQINAAGGINGKQVVLKIEDNQGTNQGGVLAFQKLTSDPNVVAIINSVRSTIVQATLPYVAQQKIPNMIGGTNPKLTNMGNQWVFRFRPNDTYASAAMEQFAVQDLHAKKVAILYDTDAFGSGGNDLLKQAFAKDNIPVVADEGYTTATKDYTSYLEKIKSSGADTLMTYMTNAEDEAQMLRQFRQLGLKMNVVGSPSIATDVCIQLAGDAVNGTYGVSDFVTDANDAAKQFTKDYEAKYHETPDLFAGWVYDAIMVLKDVIAKNGTDPNAIRQGLLQVQNRPGVEGTYSFDQNGDGLHGYTVVKIDNQKVHTIKYVDFSKH